MSLRSPICVVVGHVDHGKSSLLDYIRGSRITAKEAGGITQAIGASVVPMTTILKLCGRLVNAQQFSIPGLLFIDTPGHAAFTSLRKRGGMLADIAIVVVDINEGLKPQTVEALQILKETKTPFIVAANKLDLVKGYVSKPPCQVLQNIQSQRPDIVTFVEQKMYELVGGLHEHGFSSERFDRIEDYTRQIAIVPTSAHTGEGMPELLMVVAGLAQKYLEQKLLLNIDGPAIGTVLEVKEEKGLGKTLDVIIHDGVLRQQDDIVIGGLHEPIVTKVRILLQPATDRDMREKGLKFSPVTSVVAATGVKISAPHVEHVIAGMPLRVVHNNLAETKKAVQQDIADVLIETDKDGILLKADTLGSIEALIHLCKLHSIPIRTARIGEITRKDIIDAESNFEKDPAHSCILGFNVKTVESTDRVHIITSQIIYDLIDKYDVWKEKLKRVLEEKNVGKLPRPGKCIFMQNCGFRQNNPAIIGVEVLAGSLRKGMQIMKQDGSIIGNIKSLQRNKESITTAEKDEQVALSIDGATIGRQLHEQDILYTVIDEQEFRQLKEFKKQLQPHEIDLLKEYAEIKRKQNPVWGI